MFNDNVCSLFTYVFIYAVLCCVLGWWLAVGWVDELIGPRVVRVYTSKNIMFLNNLLRIRE